MEASETARLMSGIPDIPQVQNARQATELAKIENLDELIQIWRIVNEIAALEGCHFGSSAFA